MTYMRAGFECTKLVMSCEKRTDTMVLADEVPVGTILTFDDGWNYRVIKFIGFHQTEEVRGYVHKVETLGKLTLKTNDNKRRSKISRRKKETR